MSARAANLGRGVDPEDTQAVVSRERCDARLMCGANDRLVQILGFGVSSQDIQTDSHCGEEFLAIVDGPFLQ